MVFISSFYLCLAMAAVVISEPAPPGSETSLGSTPTADYQTPLITPTPSNPASQPSAPADDTRQVLSDASQASQISTITGSEIQASHSQVSSAYSSDLQMVSSQLGLVSSTSSALPGSLGSAATTSSASVPSASTFIDSFSGSITSQITASLTASDHLALTPTQQPSSLPAQSTAPASPPTMLSPSAAPPLNEYTQSMQATELREAMTMPFQENGSSQDYNDEIMTAATQPSPSLITLFITDVLSTSSLGLQPTKSRLQQAPSESPSVTLAPTFPNDDADDASQPNKLRAMSWILGTMLSLVSIALFSLCILMRRRHKRAQTQLGPPTDLYRRGSTATLETPYIPQKDNAFTCIDLNDPPPNFTEKRPTNIRVQGPTPRLGSRFSVTSSEYSESLEQFTARVSRQSRNFMNVISSMVKRSSVPGVASPLLTPQEFFTLPIGDAAPYRRWHELVQSSGLRLEALENEKRIEGTWAQPEAMV